MCHVIFENGHLTWRINESGLHLSVPGEEHEWFTRLTRPLFKMKIMKYILQLINPEMIKKEKWGPEVFKILQFFFQLHAEWVIHF